MGVPLTTLRSSTCPGREGSHLCRPFPTHRPLSVEIGLSCNTSRTCISVHKKPTAQTKDRPCPTRNGCAPLPLLPSCPNVCRPSLHGNGNGGKKGGGASRKDWGRLVTHRSPEKNLPLDANHSARASRVGKQIWVVARYRRGGRRGTWGGGGGEWASSSPLILAISRPSHIPR